jgi:hypothetical protein
LILTGSVEGYRRKGASRRTGCVMTVLIIIVGFVEREFLLCPVRRVAVCNRE